MIAEQSQGSPVMAPNVKSEFRMSTIKEERSNSTVSHESARRRRKKRQKQERGISNRIAGARIQLLQKLMGRHSRRIEGSGAKGGSRRRSSAGNKRIECASNYSKSPKRGIHRSKSSPAAAMKKKLTPAASAKKFFGVGSKSCRDVAGQKTANKGPVSFSPESVNPQSEKTNAIDVTKNNFNSEKIFTVERSDLVEDLVDDHPSVASTDTETVEAKEIGPPAQEKIATAVSEHAEEDDDEGASMKSENCRFFANCGFVWGNWLRSIFGAPHVKKVAWNDEEQKDSMQ